MAWISITNAQVSPGAPASASLLQALRDNFAAMANGDSGAPRIQAPALGANSVTNAVIANGTINASKFQAGATETFWIQERYAAVTAGQVGTFAFLGVTTGSGTTYNWDPDTPVPGSLLSWAGIVNGDVSLGSTVGFGSWRCMGDLDIPSSADAAGLFFRIS